MRKTKMLAGPEQIEAMKSLTQQAAGWLAGVSPRALRDHPELPRDGAGRYNARDVVEWAAGRVQAAELADEDVERLLLISERLYLDTGGATPAILDALRELRKRHGDAGLAAFVETLIGDWEALVGTERPGSPEVRPEDVRRRVAQEVERETGLRSAPDRSHL